MNDLAIQDREPVRLADGPADDPAAFLLRSARADVAPMGAKDRARAKLGIADGIGAENAVALPLPGEMPKPRRLRERRSRRIEPFIPFQNLIVPGKPASMRKAGAVVVASLQVAAILAALFVRPFPKFEPPQESVASRTDEPELLFFTSKTKAKSEAAASERLAQNNPKPGPLLKNSGTRPSLERETSAWRESIVKDEQAGVFTENAIPREESLQTGSRDNAKIALNIAPTPVPFGADMVHPVRIAGIEPTYPTIARMRNVSGTVIMRCVVTTQGLARDCQIYKSPAYLDEAVLSASRTWRFALAIDKGRPVSVYYVFKIKFQLG